MKRLLNFILFVGFSTLLFTSCGAKKKTSNITYHTKDSTTKTPISKHKGNVVQYYADLLGTSSKHMNSSLYEYIDEWMGAPHRLGGVDKNGIDCSGFVGNIFVQIYHKNLPRTSKDMGEIVKRKYDDQLKEGDLLFFSFGGKSIDHVGIYLSNDKFVHVSTKQGVVISNLKDPWYYKYFVRCGSVEI